MLGGDPVPYHSGKKGKKKKSIKPKKLDAQSTIDQPMQNRPMLNWT